MANIFNLFIYGSISYRITTTKKKLNMNINDSIAIWSILPRV